MKAYIDWKLLRKKFFSDCVVKDSMDGLKLRIDYAPHDLFEWFKRELNAPSIDVEGVRDIKEAYKQWCKETKRNGSVLVGGSIQEFFEWLDESGQQDHIADVREMVQGYNEQHKGWVALFKDEDEYTQFLKWRQQAPVENILPTDDEVSKWYSENIDYGCSASSGIYKFRRWLNERAQLQQQAPEPVEVKDEIDYKFINYDRESEDGVSLWISDNPPIKLRDCYELARLERQLRLINKKIWEEPF